MPVDSWERRGRCVWSRVGGIKKVETLERRWIRGDILTISRSLSRRCVALLRVEC